MWMWGEAGGGSWGESRVYFRRGDVVAGALRLAVHAGLMAVEGVESCLSPPPPAGPLPQGEGEKSVS